MGNTNGFTQICPAVLPPQTHDGSGPSVKQIRKIRKLSKLHDTHPLSETDAETLKGHDITNTITQLEQLEGVVERRSEQDHEYHRRREQHDEQHNLAMKACSHQWLAEGYCGLCGSEKASVEAQHGTG